MSNFSVEQFRLARRHGRYVTLQPKYNLLQRQIEKDLLPYCRAEDIGTLVYSPLERGLLTGKYEGTESFSDHRKDDPLFQGDRFGDVCTAVRSLREIAEGYGLSLVQLILAATLAHPGVTCAIVGIKDAGQIEDAAGAMSVTLGREDYHAVRAALQNV